VLELITQIWGRMRGDRELRLQHDPPFKYDVRKRVPDVSKAARLLGFRAETPLETALDEVIPWIEGQVRHGRT
jgi:nucleoside-diphosphate-sugar epimerase